MELQGVIRNRSQLPLGSLESIESRLQQLFPGVTFQWSPSGPEKLAELDSRHVDLPPLVRRILNAQPSNRCGESSSELATVTFNCGHGDQVECIWLTISGDDRESDRILANFREIGWTIMDEQVDVVRVAPDDPVNLKGNATLFVEKHVDIEKIDG